MGSEQAVGASLLSKLGRRGALAAALGTAATLMARAKPAFADQTISDNLIVTGFLKVASVFLANGANAFGGAPMVLKQITGNNGIVITDEGGANRKDMFVGLDTTLSHVHIQAVQEGIAYLDTAINPSGGNVGIRTAAPVAPLHVAGNAQVDGSLAVNGNLTVQGTKSRAVQTASHGMRKLYAVEAPENWFEDIGWASLSQGHVRVNLDPIFFETVDTQIRYAVFLTPIGECNGLYVAGLDPLGFEVRELQGGTSAVEFQYRVIAKARGLANVRLSEFTPAKRGG